MTDRHAERIQRELGNWTPELVAERKAINECAIANDWCLVHECAAGFGHYLDTRPKEDRGHNPQTGIAYND
jgi:hypothetical protein